MDECEDESSCDHVCINSVGNYTCRCYEGYQLYGLTHCAGQLTLSTLIIFATIETRAKTIWQTATLLDGAVVCKRNLFDYVLSYLPGSSTLREVGPGVGCIYDHDFGRREGFRWSAMFPFERAMVVSYALHCDHCAIYNHSAAISHRKSPRRSNQQGWANLGKMKLTNVRQTLRVSGRDMGLSFAKENMSMRLPHFRSRDVIGHVTIRPAVGGFL